MTYQQLKKLHKQNYYLQRYFDENITPTLVIDYHDKVIQINKSFSKQFSQTKENLNRTVWYEKIMDDNSALKLRHTLKSKNKKNIMIKLAPSKHEVVHEYECHINQEIKGRIVLSFNDRLLV
jgi:transcriptional regulator with PAS, ATPase and Fis domain